MDGIVTTARWVEVASFAALAAKGRLLVRPEGRQIVLFLAEAEIHACNNRCPHEGYPLSEGTLARGADGHCLLTCNWHNWKFDLDSGETLIGGDSLRRFPARREGDAVLLDLSEPPPAARQAAALAELARAVEREEYDRIARLLLRLRAAGGSDRQALVHALEETHERLEFGFVHAHAAAPDWLALGRHAASEGEDLVPALEILAYLAEVTARRREFPYASASVPWDATAFLAAVEAEDETAAIARIRGAFAEAVSLQRLWPVLARAALAHYADFGHSLIYVQKASELVAQLGPRAAAPLLLALVRSLVLASREDLIPEFRRYPPALAAWGQGKEPPGDFLGLSVKGALKQAVAASAHPQALHRALLRDLARQLLLFDAGRQQRPELALAESAGWLDVTHGLTFASAVRWAAALDPALLAPGLLQMACFLGRNSGFLDRSVNEADWQVDDPRRFFAEAGHALLDHGESEGIVAAHRVKTLTAIEREATAVADDPALVALLAAACRRFLASGLRLKHPLRTARQALRLVESEAPF
jgi:nitrite reductase/ring-hydroxylating ferredoxin subunit